MIQKEKVFLSSAQFQDEFLIERELLPMLFSKEPLKLFFDLWKIEDQAAPISPHAQYINNIDNSKIVILLIDSLIRPAVKNEYTRACEKGKDIFVFIRKNGNRSAEAVEFIRDIQNSKKTTALYESISNLQLLIEESLLGYYSNNRVIKEDDEKEKAKFDIEERTLRMALALLRKEEAAISKTKIMKLLIKEKMYQNEFAYSHIVKLLGIFEESAIKLAFNELQEEHEVLSVPGNLYKLREDIKIEFENESVEIDLYERTAIEIIHNSFPEKTKYSYEAFSSLLRECISLIMYWTTLSIKNNGKTDTIEIAKYDSESIKTMIMEAIIQIIHDPAMDNKWYEMINSVMMSEREEIVFWLNSIRKSYWFLAMMGLDPEISRLYTDNLKEYKIYLDSHIVIRAMVKAGSEASICNTIIEKGKSNEVDMFLSKPIFDEIEISFQNADRMYRNCGGDIKRITDLLTNINRRSDIIDGFIQAKSSNMELDWNTFILQYYSRQNENILREYITHELGIKIQNDCEFDEEAWGEIQDFYTELLAKRATNLKRRKEKSGNIEEEDIRQMNLRTNEAKQLETIYRLKQKGENDYWFITYDSFIYRVCADIYRKNEFKAKYYPCYMKPNKWLEILEMSSNNGIELNSFREILMSSGIHLAVNTIEAKVVNQMLERQLDKRVKDKKVLKNMFHEAVNKTATEDIENDLSGKNKSACTDDPEIESFIKRILFDKMKDYESILSAQDRELVKARKERQKALNKAGYFKKELTKYVKNRNRKKK